MTHNIITNNNHEKAWKKKSFQVSDLNMKSFQIEIDCK